MNCNEKCVFNPISIISTLNFSASTEKRKENQTGACDGKMHSCNINNFAHRTSLFIALFISLNFATGHHGCFENLKKNRQKKCRFYVFFLKVYSLKIPLNFSQ